MTNEKRLLERKGTLYHWQTGDKFIVEIAGSNEIYEFDDYQKSEKCFVNLIYGLGMRQANKKRKTKNYSGSGEPYDAYKDYKLMRYGTF